MPRRSFTPTQWKVTVPEVVAGRIEKALGNLNGTKPIYGARSALISLLLQNWLRERDGQPLLSIPAPNDPNLITKLEELRDADAI